MPPSGNEEAGGVAPGRGLAVAAEVLYLANLLLLPGIAFAVLAVVYLRHARRAPSLARCHLRQTLAASLWAGVLLVILSAAIIGLGGFSEPSTWVVVILYFTLCHAALVLIGTLGLARALAGKAYRYPLVGRPCD